MGVIEDAADKLALLTIEVIDETGDDGFINKVAEAIGGSSQTMEEAYLTAVRVRRAELRAYAVLDQVRAAAKRGKPIGD